MGQGDQRRRWDESRARTVLRAWGRSGKSASAFCRERGIDPQRLYWWRRKLQTGAVGPETVTLVPGVLTPSAASASVTVHVSGRRAITFEVTDAARVSPAWVGQVVDALEGQR